MNSVLNAFNMGNQIGGKIKDRRDQKQISGMIASGNIQGATAAAAASGNTGQVQKLKQYAATQDAAAIKKAKEDYEIYGQIAFAAKNIPVDQRQGFIASRLQQSGRDPELATQLNSYDDDTLTAFGQSALSVKDQLAQFTTEFTTINDTAVAQRTNNFTGQATAKNAFVADPAYSDVTTRQNNEADNKLAVETLAETTRSNQATEAINSRKAATAAKKVAQDASSGAGEYGLSPVYGRDAEGNRVLIQTNKAGGVRRASLPEGITLEDDTFKTSARAQGKTQGETLANLPAIENNSERALKTVEQLLNHGGIEAGTGLSAKIPAIPGTEKYAFNVANKQAQGQVFLQGFEALKGGGVITEVEGLKAEQALARMDTAQSREDYEAGLKDYREVIHNGMAAAYRKAGKPVPQKYLSGNQPASSSSIPAGAIALLKSNPSMASAFDAKYGAGASQGVLSGG